MIPYFLDHVCNLAVEISGGGGGGGGEDLVQ